MTLTQEGIMGSWRKTKKTEDECKQVKRQRLGRETTSPPITKRKFHGILERAIQPKASG